MGTAAWQPILAVMMTADLHEISGDVLDALELPEKSGIGGILTVAPGQCTGGMGALAPPLDAVSRVKGQFAAAVLVQRLGLNRFASTPDGPVPGNEPDIEMDSTGGTR